MKTFYKVVRLRQKSEHEYVYTSAYHLGGGLTMAIGLPKSKFLLEYAMGKVTRPKVGKIFAFSTQVDAEAFEREHAPGDGAIFVGTGALAKKQRPYHLTSLYLKDDKFEFATWWWSVQDYMNVVNFHDNPKGTVLLSWFRPTECVNSPDPIYGV